MTIARTSLIVPIDLLIVAMRIVTGEIPREEEKVA